jgi:hypothetical protein
MRNTSTKRALTEADKKALVKYIEKNPAATYSEFTATVGEKITISDAGYYGYRRKIHGTDIPARVSKVALYMTVWSHAAESLSKETIDVLNSLVETLNQTKKAKWEIIQLVQPSMIEIRERSR